MIIFNLCAFITSPSQSFIRSFCFLASAVLITPSIQPLIPASHDFFQTVNQPSRHHLHPASASHDPLATATPSTHYNSHCQQPPAHASALPSSQPTFAHSNAQLHHPSPRTQTQHQQPHAISPSYTITANSHLIFNLQQPCLLSHIHCFCIKLQLTIFSPHGSQHFTTARQHHSLKP